MFEDAHPCDAVLVSQQWLRNMTGKSKDELPDPEFLVNSLNGLPEHVVLKVETLRMLQFLATKGLLKELNTKLRPEELATLLNKSTPSPGPASPAEDGEPQDTIDEPPMIMESQSMSLGTVCLSGLVSNISEFPFIIGHNQDECSLVLPKNIVRKPSMLLPVHCVIDKKGDLFAIESFGPCSIDSVPIKTNAIMSLKPGSTISIAGAQISFFPSQ